MDSHAFIRLVLVLIFVCFYDNCFYVDLVEFYFVLFLYN